MTGPLHGDRETVAGALEREQCLRPVDPPGRGGEDASPSLIDEIVREGARRMLAEALRAEVAAYIAQLLISAAGGWTL